MKNKKYSGDQWETIQTVSIVTQTRDTAYH
jgi:hypothetical protein